MDIGVPVEPTGHEDEYQRVGMTYVAWKDRRFSTGLRGYE